MKHTDFKNHFTLCDILSFLSRCNRDAWVLIRRLFGHFVNF